MIEITSVEFEKEVLEPMPHKAGIRRSKNQGLLFPVAKPLSHAKLYGNDVKFLKIFRQKNRELSDQLVVKSSPTLIFFDNGKEVGDRLTGGVKRSDIIKNLNKLLPESKVASITDKIKPTISEFDVMILGAGPGGLTAGLYLCQAKVNTVLIDIALPGGHVATTHEVSNYPGFIEPQAGYMLSHNMSEQTKLCGTAYKVAVDVTRVDLQLVDARQARAQRRGGFPAYTQVGKPQRREAACQGLQAWDQACYVGLWVKALAGPPPQLQHGRVAAAQGLRYSQKRVTRRLSLAGAGG